jgi:hypothetical protein
VAAAAETARAVMKGDADIPDLKIDATMTSRKNADHLPNSARDCFHYE